MFDVDFKLLSSAAYAAAREAELQAAKEKMQSVMEERDGLLPTAEQAKWQQRQLEKRVEELGAAADKLRQEKEALRAEMAEAEAAAAASAGELQVGPNATSAKATQQNHNHRSCAFNATVTPYRTLCGWPTMRVNGCCLLQAKLSALAEDKSSLKEQLKAVSLELKDARGAVEIESFQRGLAEAKEKQHAAEVAQLEAKLKVRKRLCGAVPAAVCVCAAGVSDGVPVNKKVLYKKDYDNADGCWCCCGAQERAAELEEQRAALEAAAERTEGTEGRLRELYEANTRLEAHVADLESRKRAPLYQKKQEEELMAAYEKAKEHKVLHRHAQLFIRLIGIQFRNDVA